MNRAKNVQAWTEDGKHYVAVCDEDNDPLRGSRHTCDNPEDAAGFAAALGKQMGLEVVTGDLER